MLASSLLVLTIFSAAPNVHPLKFHLVSDSVATGVGAAAWLSSETVFKKRLAPKECRWCDRDAEGNDTLNSLDRWGTGLAAPIPQQQAWDFWSGAVDYVAVPLATIGTDFWLAYNDEALDGVGTDALIIGEAVVTAMVINQGVKFLAGRERPFVHRLRPDEKPFTEQPTDNNLSFFSGHSTFAFAVLAASATVADLRGYRHAEWVWLIGAPVAACVPLMRMAADKHYLTDVLTGAVIGSAVGIAMPRLLHGRTDSGFDVAVIPAGNGVAVDVRF